MRLESSNHSKEVRLPRLCFLLTLRMHHHPRNTRVFLPHLFGTFLRRPWHQWRRRPKSWRRRVRQCGGADGGGTPPPPPALLLALATALTYPWCRCLLTRSGILSTVVHFALSNPSSPAALNTRCPLPLAMGGKCAGLPLRKKWKREIHCVGYHSAGEHRSLVRWRLGRRRTRYALAEAP